MGTFDNNNFNNHNNYNGYGSNPLEDLGNFIGNSVANGVANVGNFFREIERNIANGGTYTYNTPPVDSTVNNDPQQVTPQSNVIINIDNDVYRNSKAVLAQLGIPIDVAVNMFLCQVAIQKKIPFDMQTSYQPPAPQDPTDTNPQ